MNNKKYDTGGIVDIGFLCTLPPHDHVLSMEQVKALKDFMNKIPNLSLLIKNSPIDKYTITIANSQKALEEQLKRTIERKGDSDGY